MNKDLIIEETLPTIETLFKDYINNTGTKDEFVTIEAKFQNISNIIKVEAIYNRDTKHISIVYMTNRYKFHHCYAKNLEIDYSYKDTMISKDLTRAGKLMYNFENKPTPSVMRDKLDTGNPRYRSATHFLKEEIHLSEALNLIKKSPKYYVSRHSNCIIMSLYVQAYLDGIDDIVDDILSDLVILVYQPDIADKLNVNPHKTYNRKELLKCL